MILESLRDWEGVPGLDSQSVLLAFGDLDLQNETESPAASGARALVNLISWIRKANPEVCFSSCPM